MTTVPRKSESFLLRVRAAAAGWRGSRRLRGRFPLRSQLEERAQVGVHMHVCIGDSTYCTDDTEVLSKAESRERRMP